MKTQVTIEQKAIETFGKEKVEEIKTLVEVSDPDMTCLILASRGDENGMRIVKLLYFENDDNFYQSYKF